MQRIEVLFQLRDKNLVDAQVVQAATKWKRMALKQFAMQPGEGLSTDVRAIRKDYFLNHDHNAYVDQWDWELTITDEQRRLDFLTGVVQKIWSVLKGAEPHVQELFPQLKTDRYRPVRFHPYAVDEGVQVAAVWTRDSRAWQMVHDLSADQMQTKDQELREQGLIPIEVAGYLGRDEDGQPVSRYTAIWVESAGEENEVRMYAGVPVGSEQTQHAEPWSEAGFKHLIHRLSPLSCLAKPAC